MPFRTPLDLYQDRITALDRRRLLRPMSGSEIIDQSVRLIQIHGLKILGFSLVPASLIYLSLISFGTFIAPSIFGSRFTDVTAQTSEIVIAAVTLVLVVVPLLVIGVSFAADATSRLASSYMLGEKPNVQTIFAQSFKSQPAMAWAIGFSLIRAFAFALVAGLAIVLMAFLNSIFPNNLAINLLVVLVTGLATLSAFLIPPLVLGSISLVPAIFSIEGISGLAAVKRSKELLRGQAHVPSGYGNVIGAWMLVVCVALLVWGGLESALSLFGLSDWVASLVANARFGPVVLGTVEALPEFVAVWLTVPLYSSVLAILYYDRRVRLEAYDIKTLAKDVFESDSRRPLA